MVKAHHGSQRCWINSQSRNREFLELERIIETWKYFGIHFSHWSKQCSYFFFFYKVPNRNWIYKVQASPCPKVNVEAPLLFHFWMLNVSTTGCKKENPSIWESVSWSTQCQSTFGKVLSINWSPCNWMAQPEYSGQQQLTTKKAWAYHFLHGILGNPNKLRIHCILHRLSRLPSKAPQVSFLYSSHIHPHPSTIIFFWLAPTVSTKF